MRINMPLICGQSKLQKTRGWLLVATSWSAKILLVIVYNRTALRNSSCLADIIPWQWRVKPRLYKRMAEASSSWSPSLLTNCCMRNALFDSWKILFGEKLDVAEPISMWITAGKPICDACVVASKEPCSSPDALSKLLRRSLNAFWKSAWASFMFPLLRGYFAI